MRKLISFAFLFGFFLPYFLNAQDATTDSPCGCDAALRYDVLLNNNDFYSELSFGRYIEQSSTKKSKSKTGITVPVLDLPIGFDDERSKSAQSKYKEYMYNDQVMHQLELYESRVTPNASYATYTKCIELCLKGKGDNYSGINVFKVSDDENDAKFMIDYRNPAGGEIKFKYTYGKVRNKVNVKAGVLEPITVKRKKAKVPFDVTFVASGTSFNIQPQRVYAYQPLDQEKYYTIRYKLDSSALEPQVASHISKNHHNQKWKKTYTDVKVKPDTLKEGISVFDKRCDGGIVGDNIYFVVEAKENEELLDPKVSFRVNKWTYPRDPEKGWAIKNNKKLIYNLYTWTKPLEIQFSFTRKLSLSKTIEYPIYVNSGEFNIVIPTNAKEKTITYYKKGGRQEILFSGNADVKLVGSPLADGKLTFYNFQVTSEQKVEK